MRFLASFIVLVAAGAFAAIMALNWEAQNFAAPGPSRADTTLIIKPGTGLRQTAEQLVKAGVISDANLFRFGVVRRHAAIVLKAGEFAFPAHASMSVVLDMLVQGKSIQHRLTIAEGLTSKMAVAIVNGDTVLVGQTGAVPPEGSLLPETYLYQRGTTRDQILARMHAAQRAFIAELWPARKRGLPYNSVEEALTLASIVEKETAIPSERPRIAAVFANRLKRGMKLESDPTIIYGLTEGYPLGHDLRQSELAKPNPYSTYQVTGLPPTPICNPGKDAIEAVLNPPDTDELYFVADGSGGHVFSKTMAEHEKNVARLRHIEREHPAGEH
jgi:peptidoglycan lytic transglycosylase G